MHHLRSHLGSARSWGRGRRRVVGCSLAAIIVAVAVGLTAVYALGGGTSGAKGPQSTAPAGHLELKVINWIKAFSPGGGASGPEEGAFGAVLSPDCGGNDVLQSVNFTELAGYKPTYFQYVLYEGAASACLAAFQNRPDLWPRADDALNRVSARITEWTAARSTRQFDCLSLAAYRLYREIVDLHKKNPGTRFARGAEAAATSPACPQVTRVVPDHGPSQGGYPVRLIGVNLYQGERFFFSWNHLLTGQAVSDDEAVVTVPPAGAGDGQVDVRPWDWPSMAGGGATFTYDPLAGGTFPTGR